MVTVTAKKLSCGNTCSPAFGYLTYRKASPQNRWLELFPRPAAFLAHDTTCPKKASSGPPLCCDLARFITPPPGMADHASARRQAPLQQTNGNSKMAQAIGYVTKSDDNSYEGTPAMMSLKKRISILPNTSKETDAQPD